MVGGARDESLEARFADVDVARRRRQDPTVADQKCFGREPSDRDTRGNGNTRPVQHTVGDLDGARRLVIEARTALQFDQAAREPILLGSRSAARGGQLQAGEAELRTSFSIGRDEAIA